MELAFDQKGGHLRKHINGEAYADQHYKDIEYAQRGIMG